jgi:hypothetical protein
MDESSENSISSESTFNEELENIEEKNQIFSKELENHVKNEISVKDEKNVKDEKSVKDEKNVKDEKSVQKKQNNSVETTSKNLLKARQLLILSDERDYELENPCEKKNFNYFGAVKPIIVEKNLTPLKVYVYGNYQHFQKSTTYFMLRKAGVEISNKLNGKYDVGIYWDPRMDINKQTPKLKQNGKKIRLINLFLVDTAKGFVAESFETHFGYGYKVDPMTFNGYCISKHNGNGTKSCFFLKCPIDANDIFKDHSYQKIIDYTDKKDPNTLYELRIPIVGGIIPCILFKTRNRGLRFTSKNRSIQIVNPLKYLTEDECNKIITYCRYIGLEMGEIDVLRSHEDGNIYIIDVNNTSWWPPNKLGDIDRNIVLNLMWNAFLESFLPKHFNEYHIPDNMIDDFIYTKTPDKNQRKKIVYKYKETRFIRNQYRIHYKVMWRQLYRSNENIDFEEERLDDDDSVQEEGKTELANIVSSKINQDHIKKMNRIFKKQPHLSKMFMNEKLEKEKKEKEQQDKDRNKRLQEASKKKLLLLKKQQEEKLSTKLKPVQNIMSPQIMEKFQEFLKFQQIQSGINQLPSVPLEIKTFREFTDTNEQSVKADKKTEVIIKQNRPLNLTEQRQSLLNILNKKKK